MRAVPTAACIWGLLPGAAVLFLGDVGDVAVGYGQVGREASGEGYQAGLEQEEPRGGVREEREYHGGDGAHEETYSKKISKRTPYLLLLTRQTEMKHGRPSVLVGPGPQEKAGDSAQHRKEKVVRHAQNVGVGLRRPFELHRLFVRVWSAQEGAVRFVVA